jgi:ubiquinone/menaquinone biosynthesis C-methylase UbiE
MDDLRPVEWHRANAERMPFSSDSQDIVTSIFLLHELPATARLAVAGEVARVLKPGGIFVMIDSLQFGDKPGWDGLLEAFPDRFHEPYYGHFLADDLAAMFTKAGLHHAGTRHAFLSKVMTFVKPG